MMKNTRKAYELWATQGQGQKLLQSSNTLTGLIRAWRRHYTSAALRAVHVVGGKEIEINDQMPVVERPLTEFRSAEERDARIIAEAEYFTIIRFLGVGRYERHERPTQVEAETLGQELSNQEGSNYLIYAVNARGNSVYVTTTKPFGRKAGR